jgi:hypothetical protein
MSAIYGENLFFKPKVTKTVTFLNTPAAPLTLFTVTGDVIVKIIAVCDTSLVSAAAANISVGTAAAPTAIIANTVATAIDARMIWYDAAPDAEIEAFSTTREYIITDGNDIILTPSQIVDSGVLVFYCDWVSLSGTGSVA